ncbi:hypothetical protein Pd630_LPD05882 [Rhodococcus opacus PD630]|nr:hypothetical protein Pd630_LPD05882 [Rhodococcus opacus PD630]
MRASAILSTVAERVGDPGPGVDLDADIRGRCRCQRAI